LSQGAFSRGIKAILAAAGLPQTTTVHALRHTVATLALRGRQSPHVVAALLGHSNVTTTLRIYAHSLPGDVRAAVESVERTISGSR
jgi:integrase